MNSLIIAYISFFLISPLVIFFISFIIAVPFSILTDSTNFIFPELSPYSTLLIASVANLIVSYWVYRKIRAKRFQCRYKVAVATSFIVLLLSFERISWVIFHLDDLVYASTLAALNHVIRPDAKAMNDLKILALGKDPKGTLVHRADIQKKYVIFSDYHMLEIGAKHDHFKKWGLPDVGKSNFDIYLMAIRQYYNEGFYLVENGDVEDLLVKPPSFELAVSEQFFDSLLGFFGNLYDARVEREERKNKLLGIYLNYKELYSQVSETFLSTDRLIKIIGNHDESLKDPYILEVLRRMYGRHVDVFEYLALVDEREGPLKQAPAKVVVAHGHQFDPYCAPVAEEMVGEVYTESLAWFGTGADRIWPKDTQEPVGWRKRMNKEIGFENRISRAPSFLREHNVAMKWRHMDERRAAARVSNLREGDPIMPTLILGHTHEPKLRALDEEGKVIEKYVNTGSAGLYEQLVWAVEVVNGTPSVHAWHWNDNGDLVKKNMQPTEDGHLVPDDDEKGANDF